jgi:hypothetical protein
MIYFDLAERKAMKKAAEGHDMMGFLMKADLTRADGTFEPGEWTGNSIVNLGYKDIWDVYFKNAADPASFELHLAAAIAGFDLETIIGDVTAVSGTGYAHQDLAYADFTNAGSPMVCTAAQKTFTAGGNWTAAIGAYLTTPAAAILICYDAFAAPRTLFNGDTLKVTLTLTREAATE